MNLDNLNKWLTLAANVGVLASIIFLGLELQQNTSAVQGATYQAMSDSTANQYSDVMNNPELLENLTKIFIDDYTLQDFTPAQNFQFFFYYFASIKNLENTYLQYKAGIVDDRVFDSYGWGNSIYTTKHFKESWDVFCKANCASEEFAKFFEERVGIVESN